MLVEDIFEPRPRHCVAFGVDEELRDLGGSANRQPRSEVNGRFFPKREASLLAALSSHTDTRSWVQNQVCQREAHQFGDAQPAGEAEMQHRAVPNAETRRQVRSVKNCPHFTRRKMPHQRLVVALCRYGADPHDLFKGRRDAQLNIAHERLDGCKPRVSGSCFITTLLLDVGEEAQHQSGVEVFEAEL